MNHYLTVYVNGMKQNTILLNSLPAFAAGRVTIGRSDTNDIVLPYPFVSRNHAAIEFHSGAVEIVDTGSLNKLRVGNAAYERIRLSDGMNVSIGNAENNIVLYYNTMGEEAPVTKTRSDTAEYKTPHRQAKAPAVKSPSYIGIRVFAAIMDSTICLFMGIGAAILVLLLLNSVLQSVKAIVLITFVISIFVIWIYFALGESGESKGTMGKIALGLWVVDNKTDDRLSFPQATTRFFSKLLSILILFLGFIPMFGKKQTLHDYIAGTKVVKNPRVKEA